MADIQVPSIATATPAAADTVLGVQGGAVKRMAVGNLAKVGSFTQAGTGAVARTVEAKLQDVVSVKDFGAVGDGVTDDTAAIQAAFDYLQSNGGRLIIDGVCAVSAPLTILAGAKWVIEGRGGQSDGALKAISSMAHMIDFGNSAETYEGECAIYGVTIDCNDLAEGINANYARYCIVDGVRVRGIKTGGTGIKIGQWANRITNCNIAGGSKSVELSSPSTGYFNAIAIDNNVFGNSEFGIYGASGQYALRVSILNNVFDTCAKAAIYLHGESRGLTIKGNYVEACGGAAVSVETASGVFGDRYGAIIMAKLYTAVPGWDGVDIYNNLFSTCAQAAPSGSKVIFSVENPTDLHIHDNTVYAAGTYDALVSLAGVGCVRNVVNRFHTQHADYSDKFSVLIKDDVSSSSGYGCFSAVFQKNKGYLQTLVPDVFEDVDSLTLAGLMTVTQSYVGGIRVINFNRSGSAGLVFEATDSSLLKMFVNKHIRVIGRCTPVSPPGGNNLRVRVDIDIGAGYETAFDSARADVAPERVTDGNIAFVPATATKLKITVYPTSVGEINVYGLRLVDASAPY